MIEEQDSKCGNTPLLLAAYLEKNDFVNVLVDNGASKDAVNKYNESMDDLQAFALKKNRLAFLDTEMRFLPSELWEKYCRGQLSELQFKEAMRRNILEIAVIVYDPSEPKQPVAKLNLVQHMEEFSAEAEEKSMSAFSHTHFKSNGLLQLCKSPPGSTFEGGQVMLLKDMESEVLKFLQTHFVKKLCRPVGFSVHQDVAAIKGAFPSVFSFLHYQIIDLTSVLGVVNAHPNGRLSLLAKDLLPPNKNGWFSTTGHRAMYDAEESLLFFQALGN